MTVVSMKKDTRTEIQRLSDAKIVSIAVWIRRVIHIIGVLHTQKNMKQIGSVLMVS